MRLATHLGPAGSASAERSLAHPNAKPSFGMPPGNERLVRVVDHRQRRDRGEVRRAGLRDEQLRDAGVRDPHHADLAVGDPRLRGDGLDDVVAVERLQGLEVPPGTPRAPAAAQVDTDGRVAERLRDGRRRRAAVGVRGVVPRVLDDGGVGAARRGPRQLHVDGERGAVARLHVAVAVVDRLRGVEGRWRCVSGRGDGDAVDPVGADPHRVPRVGRHIAEQHRAGGVGLGGRDRLARGRQELGDRAFRRMRDGDLLDAALRGEGRRARGRGCRARGVRGGGGDAADRDRERDEKQGEAPEHLSKGTEQLRRGTITP